MISSITIGNFKGIGKCVTIPLKPITLLFGPNSAGKSTILQALHYAFEVLQHQNVDADQTTLGGPFVDLGGFQNFVHGHDEHSAVTIGLEARAAEAHPIFVEFMSEWEQRDAGMDSVLAAMTKLKAVRIELSIRWSVWRNAPYVAQYTVALDDHQIAVIKAEPDKPDARLVHLNLQHPMLVASADDSNMDADALQELWQLAQIQGRQLQGEPMLLLVGLRDALPDLAAADPIFVQRPELQTAPDAELTRSLDHAEMLLSWMLIGPGRLFRSELEQMVYLGPLRQTPPRHFETKRSPQQGRWATGLAAWEELLHAPAERIERVSNWMAHPKRLATGYRVVVSKHRELTENTMSLLTAQADNLFDVDVADLKKVIEDLPVRRRLQLVDVRTDIRVDPEDVGEGIAQVLPVVVAVLSEKAELVVIEQPELHVHPRIQVALGDLLIERAIAETPTASDSPRAPRRVVLLIETHSEHLLLRVLKRIRQTTDGELENGMKSVRPADVSVLYIQPGANGTEVKELRVDESGEFLDPWPDGFFEERAGELF